jgi:hypothetical protein
MNTESNLIKILNDLNSKPQAIEYLNKNYFHYDTCEEFNPGIRYYVPFSD